MAQNQGSYPSRNVAALNIAGRSVVIPKVHIVHAAHTASCRTRRRAADSDFTSSCNPIKARHKVAIHPAHPQGADSKSAPSKQQSFQCKHHDDDRKTAASGRGRHMQTPRVRHIHHGMQQCPFVGAELKLSHRADSIMSQ